MGQGFDAGEFARLAGLKASDLPESVQVMGRWVGSRAKSHYPDALLFGVSYGPQLVAAARQRLAARDPEITPASLVSDTLLGTEPFCDFRFSMSLRAGLGPTHADELQGYIDATVLFVGLWTWRWKTCMGILPQDPHDEIEGWPLFQALPSHEAEAARRFVRERETWGIPAFQAIDLVDGRRFMTKLVEQVGRPPASADYVAGLRTMRDTLLLYVDLVESQLGVERR